MIGPGKYDDLATAAREAAAAAGVILAILDGCKGSGFSVQCTGPIHRRLPAMLRNMADEIEAHAPRIPDVFAWVGEDELGSGEIGIKRGLVPAGDIPLVSVDREKLMQGYIVEQLQRQADRYRKLIRLCRFRIHGEVLIVEPRPAAGRGS